jgi:hypothetical protein
MVNFGTAKADHFLQVITFFNGHSKGSRTPTHMMGYT